MRCHACGRELEAHRAGPLPSEARWCRCGPEADPVPLRPVEDLVARPPVRVADELRERLLAAFG